jgi:hypothetical protein
MDGMVEFHQMNFDLLRRGEPDRVATGVVSHNFFDVLGIQPLVGRTFADADDDEGAEAVLVLGYDYWTTRFGADLNIVGQVFQMNDRPHTVIGVLPDVPHYPNRVDLYMPTSAVRSIGRRAQHRRQPTSSGLRSSGGQRQVTFDAAATEAATVAQRWRCRTSPHHTRSGADLPVLAALLHGAADSVFSPAGLVLLIAARRQPDVGADAAPRPRVRDARGAGRRARPAGTPAARREHAAVGGGRRRRSRLRVGHAGRAHPIRLAVHSAHRRHRSRPVVLLFTLGVAVVSGLVPGLVGAPHRRPAGAQQGAPGQACR